ncbi:MAG: DNA repair and recombination protein RadB [Nanobdellota archaeon]
MISSGCKGFDDFLGGGYEGDVITTIYGPGGSGKTNLCLLSARETLKQDKKVIYIDTESSFSTARFEQIADKELMKGIIFLSPVSFEEQKKSFEKLRNIINDKIGLIIVDSIAMLYRLEFGKTNDIYEVNRSLGLQISYLTEIARKWKIPVLVTNQVYSNFKDKDSVNLVGGDIIKYGSKCLIELKKGKSNNRTAIIRKHRSLPEDKEYGFRITDEGIRPKDL